MDISSFNPTHFHPSHKAKTWLLITIIIIGLGAGGVYYFVKKTYDAKQSQTKPTTSEQTTRVAAKPAEQAKQVADELKAVNLAEIKSAVNDIKDILAAF